MRHFAVDLQILRAASQLFKTTTTSKWLFNGLPRSQHNTHYLAWDHHRRSAKGALPRNCTIHPSIHPSRSRYFTFKWTAVLRGYFKK